jgi:hypothetical protein
LANNAALARRDAYPQGAAAPPQLANTPQLRQFFGSTSRYLGMSAELMTVTREPVAPG